MESFYRFIEGLAAAMLAWSRDRLHQIEANKRLISDVRVVGPTDCRLMNVPEHMQGQIRDPKNAAIEQFYAEPQYPRTAFLSHNDGVTTTINKEPEDMVDVAYGGPFDHTFLKKGNNELYEKWRGCSDRIQTMARSVAEKHSRHMTVEMWNAYRRPQSRIGIKAMK